MIGPTDPIKDVHFWKNLDDSDLLFPQYEGEDLESTDLIIEFNERLEQLTDLCGRLSFTMREISQVLKVKN